MRPRDDPLKRCTAVVTDAALAEHHDGRFELIRWADIAPEILALQPSDLAREAA